MNNYLVKFILFSIDFSINWMSWNSPYRPTVRSLIFVVRTWHLLWMDKFKPISKENIISEKK